ncbi:MAG: hypothetical protein MJ252_06085 [archaeon]|nr:hypothetical protein [archaeon]
MAFFVFSYFSKAWNVPYDQVALIMIMIFCTPLGMFSHLLRNPTVRLYYNLIFGLLFQYLIFGFEGMIHVLISTVVTYLFMKYWGRTKSPFILVFYTFSHLSFLHIQRMFAPSDWKISYPDTVYMLTMLKFTSMAFSYADGGEEQEKKLVNLHHKVMRIKELPSFTEVLSFVYFYPTCIIGPHIEFKDYIDYTYLRGRYGRLNLKIVFKEGFKYLLLMIFCMVIYGSLGAKYKLSYLGTEEIGREYNLIQRIGYLFFSIIIHRMKFNSGLLETYVALIFSGFSYNETVTDVDKYDKGLPQDELKYDFELGTHGNILEMEFGISPKLKFIIWNPSIHIWLKYSLFLRLININHKFFFHNFTLASYCVFLCSALWHGFYPVYYLVFPWFFMWQNYNDKFDKLGFAEYIDKSNVPFQFIMWIINQFLMNCLSAVFFILDYPLVKQFMKNLYCIPMIMIFGSFLYGLTLKMPKKKKEGKVTDEGEKLKDDKKKTA